MQEFKPEELREILTKNMNTPKEYLENVVLSSLQRLVLHELHEAYRNKNVSEDELQNILNEYKLRVDEDLLSRVPDEELEWEIEEQLERLTDATYNLLLYPAIVENAQFTHQVVTSLQEMQAMIDATLDRAGKTVSRLHIDFRIDPWTNDINWLHRIEYLIFRRRYRDCRQLVRNIVEHLPNFWEQVGQDPTELHALLQKQNEDEMYRKRAAKRAAQRAHDRRLARRLLGYSL